MDTYTPAELAKLDPVAISNASPRHIQSVLEKLIATAHTPNAVGLEQLGIVAMLEDMRKKSNNSLFRSALTCAAGEVRARYVRGIA